jgi:dUTP pyrophosphatase
MKLRVKKLSPDAQIPHYAYDDDAAFDLFSAETVALAPMQRAQVKTGLAMEIPRGYVGLIWDKSGLSHKHGLKMLGGVIDSGYRGDVTVGVINLGTENYTIEKGHKIGQMLIQAKETCEIEEVAELSDSPRGEKGFGSSGK